MVKRPDRNDYAATWDGDLAFARELNTWQYDHYEHRLTELEKENARLREALEGLRQKHHYDCEDSWYSCATITCDDSRRDTACDCGMDTWNEAIDKALQAQP